MFENELALPSLHNGLHGTFHGQHHPWLVVLSVVIAIFTSGMALHLAAEARNARSRVRKELEEKVATIEQRLAGLEKRKLELVELLQDGATYADAVKFRALSEELEKIEPRIAQETSAWEKAAEELEQQTPANG